MGGEVGFTWVVLFMGADSLRLVEGLRRGPSTLALLGGQGGYRQLVHGTELVAERTASGHVDGSKSIVEPLGGGLVGIALERPVRCGRDSSPVPTGKPPSIDSSGLGGHDVDDAQWRPGTCMGWGSRMANLADHTFRFGFRDARAGHFEVVDGQASREGHDMGCSRCGWVRGWVGPNAA